jgi:hypothetical protein
MKIAVVTKARIGFAIAFGILIGVGEANAIAHIDAIGRHVGLFFLASAGAGVLCWIAGQFFKSVVKQESSDITPEHSEQPSENSFIFLRSLHYWGAILFLATGGAYFRASFRKTTPVAIAVVPEEIKAPVTFPPLELQGLVLNGEKSSALINGQVLFLGEGLGNVKLLSVDSEHATVGMEGETKLLSMRR